ncbi:DUF4455 domain-containing protein [Caenorhabditis elegans]|uniref:DUF4455 domain-containing protein n=1 Tax=Caenorhabditis elegans TaxID=6239 RepID=Q9TYJ5_CAEEL|nr:DUF4455 domain-containing protein [Caenorhabditis elegans]CCD69501.3 DUF4455 domain-containing protein [Caenorhabditis elegans]
MQWLQRQKRNYTRASRSLKRGLRHHARFLRRQEFDWFFENMNDAEVLFQMYGLLEQLEERFDAVRFEGEVERVQNRLDELQ